MKKLKGIICLLVLLLLVTGCSIPSLNRLRHKTAPVVKEEEQEEVKEENEPESKNYTCIYDVEEENYKASFMLNIVFNSYDNYQAATKASMTFTYDFEITDEVFKLAIEKIEENACERVDCTKDKVDLGETSYGEKTVIRRIDKSIIISYNKNTGPGMKATEEEQQSVIKSLEETGYTCG